MAVGRLVMEVAVAVMAEVVKVQAPMAEEAKAMEAAVKAGGKEGALPVVASRAMAAAVKEKAAVVMAKAAEAKGRQAVTEEPSEYRLGLPEDDAGPATQGVVGWARGWG